MTITKRQLNGLLAIRITTSIIFARVSEQLLVISYYKALNSGNTVKSPVYFKVHVFTIQYFTLIVIFFK